MLKIKYFFEKKGYLFFQIGIFFILSAPNIAAFFILLSLISTHINENKLLIKKNWVFPFFVAGLIAILSSINSSFRHAKIDGWSPSLSWLGLFNWLPFFYFLWRSQIYLYRNEMRQRISNLFLAGSVPFIFSGFGQLWFNWHGPLIFMNGLIIWFQRNLDINNNDGITAMFNNQNYAACWLIIIWPFCLYNLLNFEKFSFKKFIFFIYSILILMSVFFTKSRNGIAGTLTSSVFLSNKSFLLLAPIIIILLLFKFYSINQRLISSFVSKNFFSKISEIFQFSKFANLLNEPRIFIYMNSIPIIMEKPFLGWGAATFPILFNSRYTDFDRDPTHPHNLILEMANSYGLIFAFIVTISIFFIVFCSFKIIFLNKNKNIRNYSIDKAWWSSFFALFLSQMLDIQYFDFRISISFWILLSGLISII